MSQMTAHAKRWPTALLIPCPWSGDENDPKPRTYRAWSWLYRTVRVGRHRVGLHDFEDVPAWLWSPGNGGKESYRQRCDWCGARR